MISRYLLLCLVGGETNRNANRNLLHFHWTCHCSAWSSSRKSWFSNLCIKGIAESFYLSVLAIFTLYFSGCLIFMFSIGLIWAEGGVLLIFQITLWVHLKEVLSLKNVYPWLNGKTRKKLYLFLPLNWKQTHWK